MPTDRTHILLKLGEADQSGDWPDYLQYGFVEADVPALLDLVADETLDQADSASSEVWAPLHAWRTLGQLGSSKTTIRLIEPPRHSDWGHCFAHSPVLSAFLAMAGGSACATSFSRIAQRSLTLRPAHSLDHLKVIRYIEGFSHFVTSMTAPIASGWNDSRVGLSPTGKTPP